MGRLRDRLKIHEEKMLAEFEEKRASRKEEEAKLEKCTRCGGNRVLFIHAHPSDLCNTEYQGRKKEGYLPYIDAIGGGDDVDVAICLDCGQAQGDFPVDNEWVEEYFDEEED